MRKLIGSSLVLCCAVGCAGSDLVLGLPVAVATIIDVIKMLQNAGLIP